MKFPQRINKIIPKVLTDMHIDACVKNWVVVDKWPEIVGKNIAQHARATAVDAHTLFVDVDNPVWQGQLFLMKHTLLEKIKKCDVSINEIVFRISQPTGTRRSGHEKER